VFRPTGFADLTGRRVGIFGLGVEGRATRRRLAGVTADLVVVDDHPSDDEVLATADGGLAVLMTCDVVIKSPGIPRRRDDVIALEAHGVSVTSALNLWMHEVDRTRVIAVTGTKGKSTTTSLIAFFLTCLGEEAVVLGNIGRPPYDPDVATSRGWLVVEVSSFQSLDLTLAPSLVCVTSLGADHLDWHGSLAQYHQDKLQITRAAGDHVTLLSPVSELRDATDSMGGELVIASKDETGLSERLGLLGAHNDLNVGLALDAVARVTGRDVDHVRAAATAHAAHFVPLRGRLTPVATSTRTPLPLRFVDDGLATAPLPTLAALEVFADQSVALIAGGFDRGVDYRELAEFLDQRAHPTHLVFMGPAGERLARQCRSVARHPASDMASAVRLAADALPAGGVVLLSPAAPSFDAYRDWSERSDDFARCVARYLETITPD